MDLILFAVACPLFQTETHFFPAPLPSGEMQSDNIKCSESLSFTLHGVRSNFKTPRSVADKIISEKSGGRLFCISKVRLLEFVLGEYYKRARVADLPIRRSCSSEDRH